MFKKTILIDLDGVLNTYTGNYDKNIIPSMKEGAKEFLEELYQCYEIKLFTTRKIELAKKWLINNNLDKYFSDITNTKEPAWLYIDDRCIRFEGNYNKLYEDIRNFKVWYK